MNYDGQLQQLQEKVSQKKSLEAKLAELQSQQKELKSHVWELREIMQNEQADVDRLERASLASVFYAVLGKKEGMLDKEKMEAYAARVKHDSAAQELELVNEDICHMREQLKEVSDCEHQYEALLREKGDAVKASGSEEAGRIFQIEEKIIAKKSLKREISEAISAGSRALSSADSILSSLNSAKSWGTWDLVGGGMVSSIAKHSHLDEAQSKVQKLQNELRQFKTELADVTVQAEMQVSVDGFLRFADYFFDGLFADWMVLDKISRSQSSVESTRSQIKNVLSRLRSLEASASQEIRELEAEKDGIIRKVTL